MICVVCQEENAWAEIGKVCRRCHARTPSHLRQLPRLYVDLVSLGYVERDGTWPRISYPPGHERAGEQVPHWDPVAHALTAGPLAEPTRWSRVAGTRPSREPVKLDAVDLSGPARNATRALHARGVLGIDEDQTGHLSVATVLDTWVRDWASYRQESLPDPQVPLLTGWLLDRWDWACEVHPAVDEFAAEVRDVYVTLSAVTGQLPARPEIRDRECPKCQMFTLSRDPDSGYTECNNLECRTMLTEDEYREYLRDLIANHPQEDAA